MNIQLQTQGFELTPAIEAHTLKQLRFHLANFDSHVIGADVFLKDINGPKGGLDKKVLIHVRLASRMTITIERTRADLYDAVTIAARQTKRAVRRTLNKHRRMEKFTLREFNRLTEA